MRTLWRTLEATALAWISGMHEDEPSQMFGGGFEPVRQLWRMR